MADEKIKEEIEYYSPEEKAQIKKRYRKILRLLKPHMKEGDSKLIRDALNVSVEAHKEMRRKSGEPYIYHPLEVALICIDEIGLGPTSVACALLHDVVEDTTVTLEDIKRDFGPKVAQIIDGLTKIAENFEQAQSAQAENFRKMLLTLSEDVRVILIKLADRLHNMRTLSSMARNSQLKIANETIYIYAPLAHRLGLYQIKSELEDLYLRYSLPDDYYDISAKLSSTEAARKKLIDNFMRPLKKRLKDAGIEFSMKGRTKHIYSIWKKLNKSKIPFEEVYDIFAIRIIIKGVPPTEREKEKAVCWQAYSIVTDEYRPNPDRLKDWISTPRANGYESLHTTVMSNAGVWVEVQIRTQRMDDIAERGYAAHWKYKDNEASLDQPLDNWLNQVRDTLESGDSSAIEFIEDFKSNLFNEEIFVFTPKGDLKVMRQGATVLDFAFNIHTQIGAKCTAAKVNGALVPISHELSNGDQVEILTTKNQKPSADWLRFVVTSKARAGIRDLLKESNKGYILDGKEIIKRKLKNLGLENNLETLNQLRAYFNKKDYNDLYYSFGKSHILPDEISRFKRDREAQTNKLQKRKLVRDSFKDAKSFEREIKKIDGNDTLLIGDDMQKIDYTLSKCCNPIPGDDVFGFLTVNEGIKIHRNNCPNARQLLSNYGNRVIKARWASQLENSYLVNIQLTGIDRMGLIQDVTKVISSELHINMRGLSIETSDGVFEGTIKVYVFDTKHLNKLFKMLESIEGIISVTRQDDDE